MRKSNSSDVEMPEPEGRFHRGESAAATPKRLDPAAAGEQVVTEMHEGRDSELCAYGRIAENLLSFEADAEALSTFIAVLVEARIISAAEGRLGTSGPKISKLAAIGRHSPLLRRQDVFTYLATASYTTLYQLVVLANALPDRDEDAQACELVRILEAAGGDVTRKYLERETRRVKSAARTLTNGPAKHVPAPTGGETLQQLKDGGNTFDLVVLTPSAKDLALLRADYADVATLSHCLPLRDVAERDSAVLVATNIRDLSTVTEKLLPLCGYKTPSRILLTEAPKCRDITNATVMIIAGREPASTGAEETAWTENGAVTPLEIANALYPTAANRLHVFAASRTNGWNSLVGRENWAEEPSVR